MMADLDLLRDINNNYGHLAGDAVLRGIADVFREELRHYDIPARFGGEEFSILLPETTSEQALEIAERIRRALAARRFEVETSSEPIQATVSIGVASFPADGNGRQRAHPPGGPHRLPRQAPGPKPRARRQCGVDLLAKAERPQRLAFVPGRGGAAGSRRTRAAVSPVHAVRPRRLRPAHALIPRASRRFFSLSFRLGALIALRRARSASPRASSGSCSARATTSSGSSGRRGDRGRRPGAGPRGGRGQRSRSARSARSRARRSSGRAPRSCSRSRRSRWTGARGGRR